MRIEPISRWIKVGFSVNILFLSGHVIFYMCEKKIGK